MTFSAELREHAEELVGRYPGARSALLPLLHLVQAQDGYISDEGLAECAELLNLTRAEVGAVATFYTMYKREEMGTHLVSVCTNFSCKVRGADEVYERLSEKLGVGHNGTNREANITLEHAECLGNCEGAPVLTVDYYNYECVTPDMAEEIVDACSSGNPPQPTRGDIPPGVRDVEFRLAGLGGPGDQRTHAAMSKARATDGGLTPARTAESGPGFSFVAVEPVFGNGQSGNGQAGSADTGVDDGQQAEQAVRSSGQDPDDIETEAGDRANEFPTSDPDADTAEPGDADAPTDPRTDDQTPEANLDSSDASSDQKETDDG